MSYADNPTNGQLVFVWESSAVLYATIDRVGIDIPFVEACQTVNIAVAVCNAGVVFKITPDISTPDTKGQVFEWSPSCTQPCLMGAAVTLLAGSTGVLSEAVIIVHLLCGIEIISHDGYRADTDTDSQVLAETESGLQII